MKLSKVRAKIKFTEIGLLLAYKILLDVIYVVFVAPFFGYSGFFLQVNGEKLLESYLFLILLFLFLPRGERKPSSVGVKYLFILAIVPMLSLYALNDASRFFLYLVVTGFLLTLLTIQMLPTIPIKRIKNSDTVLFLGIGGMSFLVYALMIRLNGIPTLRALNLSAVYEVRATVNYGPSIMGYLVPWQAKVINPFLIAVTWYKRKYLGLLAVLGLQLILFLMTGAKLYLFSPLLLILLLYSIQKRCVFRLGMASVIAVILLSFIFYSVGGGIMVPSLLIRRMFFAPAITNFFYYDFFSQNELMHLSESKLGVLFARNPLESYDMGSANVIGMLYGGGPQEHMNTGYIGDAYMNFGAPGVIIFSFVFGVVLLILDSIARNRNPVVVTALMVWSISNMINSALFTTMLTHGLLPMMLVTWMYASRRESKNGIYASVQILQQE